MQSEAFSPTLSIPLIHVQDPPATVTGLQCQTAEEIGSVVAIGETGLTTASRATSSASDTHEAVDTEGDEGKNSEEDDDDDGDDIVFLHFDCGVERGSAVSGEVAEWEEG
jgi:hypothetical protein